MTHGPTLYLTCGLPGSGKTTLAKRLEREVPALRLTADEWLHELYPGISTEEAETGPCRRRVEPLQWATALRALELGCSVVLDWGVWAREERDFYRSRACEAGARVVLCLLDPPVDELWDRLSRRNGDRPFGAFEITKAALLRWSELFQRPTTEELALYDPWTESFPRPA
ncbi:MAG: AAA family ATPase [Caulobacteraceae bacterium]